VAGILPVHIVFIIVVLQNYIANLVQLCSARSLSKWSGFMGKAKDPEKTMRRIMRMVEDFTLDELLDLRFDLEERIQQLRTTTSAPSRQAQPSEPSVTVREEWKQCGKLNCKCMAGELHGPYRYEYWREGDRVKSRYLGRVLK
jgi:uncharacterized protein DUF6788